MAKAIYRDSNGKEVDITDLVKILYDGVINSLNWGSGWWDGEDAASVGWIGLAFGWASASEATAFAKDIKRYERFRGELDISIPEV